MKGTPMTPSISQERRQQAIRIYRTCKLITKHLSERHSERYSDDKIVVAVTGAEVTVELLFPTQRTRVFTAYQKINSKNDLPDIGSYKPGR